ncbi:MAG TPA: hypothetical protein VE953_17035 [Terriglobales bacterium]|nr:hypothetical protein [Terriglobales bacterium]
MRLVAEIVRDVCSDIRATLPADEQEGGAWLAGFCWAFAIHWSLLLLVTYFWARSVGAH